MRDARDGDGNSLQIFDGLEKFPPPQLFLHLFLFYRKLSHRLRYQVLVRPGLPADSLTQFTGPITITACWHSSFGSIDGTLAS